MRVLFVMPSIQKGRHIKTWLQHNNRSFESFEPEYDQRSFTHGDRLFPAEYIPIAPLGFAVLAGMTPPNVSLEFVDDRFETIPFERPVDLVGITVETHAAFRAYWIAYQFRKRGVPVVVGGVHPTLAADEASLYADAVVVGDAETVWHRVLEDARNKRLKKVYKKESSFFPSVMPQRSIFSRKYYFPVQLVETSRGCVHQCAFCSIPPLYRSTYRCRAISDVIAEIKHLGARTKPYVIFTDDNILGDIPRAKELFKALIPFKLRWTAQCTLTMAEDTELLKLMKQSGCFVAHIGFETLSRKNLASMNKSWIDRRAGYEEAIQMIYAHGINIEANFVYGYEEDTAEAIKKTVDFAIRHDFFNANFACLTPFPGTPVYEQLRGEGRLSSAQWWLEAHLLPEHVVYQPQAMTARSLRDLWRQSWDIFYGWPSIFRRLRGNVRHNPGFLNVFLFISSNVKRKSSWALPAMRFLLRGMPGKTAARCERISDFGVE